MKLRYCTFTGPDDKVDPADLLKISEDYPFAEWAIPHNSALEGKPRYPTTKWIEEFHAVCGKAVNKATHLSYESLSAFINGEQQIVAHIAKFSRVQLNIGVDFDLNRINPVSLGKQVASFPSKKFIFQYNDRTKHLLTEAFDDVENVEVLFDASEGTGTLPSGNKWPAPMLNRSTGYAGGMGPENIEKVLHALLGVVPANGSVWIDMETRVRTNDLFDLGKVRAVLEQVKKKLKLD